MMRQGIIFDCDGVLVDSEELSAQVLRDYLVELGLKLDVKRVDELYRGRSLQDVELDVARRLEGPAPQQFQAQIALRTRAAFDQSLRAVAGVEKLLNQLQTEQFPLAVASSGTPEKIQHSLELTSLAHFFGSHVYSATQVEHGKPAPDLFVFAAQQLGIHPKDCVVIEDSAAGVRGAVAAGTFTIGYCGATNPEELQSLGAHPVQHMHEVYSLLRQKTVAAPTAHRLAP